MRWRGVSGERDLWDRQGRFGAEGKVMDFRDVEGWTGVEE
jgi:sarcosine oxidase/L-pipecolate oxidase